MPESVVELFFFNVRQHVISLSCFFELFFGFLVSGISVGMILEGHFTIGRLEFHFPGFSGDSQDFIIIAFVHDSLSTGAGSASSTSVFKSSGLGSSDKVSSKRSVGSSARAFFAFASC